MAIIENPLSFERFQALKGVVDFAYYKGILYARMYPTKIRQPGTPAQTQCWIAMRECYKYKSLMTQHDQDGYRTLVGGSQLTWWDMFKKVFIRGWHVEQRVPPVIYDTQISNVGPGDLIICFRCAQDVDVKVLVAKKSDKKILPWKWVFDNPETTPPNCSTKGKLFEYWDEVIECNYQGRGQTRCYKVGDAIGLGGAWFTAEVKESIYEETIWRTGCWWLAF